MTIRSASTQAEFLAALGASIGGDVIECAPGNYGRVDTGGHSFASDVIVRPSVPGSPPTFGAVKLSGSAHIRFESILFDYVLQGSDSTTFACYDLVGCNFISAVGCTFDGDNDASGVGTRFGAILTDCNDCLIDRSVIRTFWKGLNITRGLNNFVTNSDFIDISSDGINIISADTVLVEGNYIGQFRIQPGSHADGIQMFTSSTAGPSKNITYRRNFIDANLMQKFQSMFFANTNAPYENIIVEDNVIYNAHTHGISMGACLNYTCRRNTLLRDANATSPDNIFVTPTIKLWGPFTGALVVEKNIAPNALAGDNLLFDMPTGAYSQNLVDPFKPGATLDDLMAKPGTTIQTGGYGAIMTRQGSAAWRTTTPPPPPPPPDPNIDPVADFTATITGLTVDFADTSVDADGIITAWGWDFGDGNTSPVQSPVHTYGADGTYSVRLTVIDDKGASGVSVQPVDVAAVVIPPPPAPDLEARVVLLETELAAEQSARLAGDAILQAQIDALSAQTTSAGNALTGG